MQKLSSLPNGSLAADVLSDDIADAMQLVYSGMLILLLSLMALAKPEILGELLWACLRAVLSLVGAK